MIKSQEKRLAGSFKPHISEANNLEFGQDETRRKSPNCPACSQAFVGADETGELNWQICRDCPYRIVHAHDKAKSCPSEVAKQEVSK